MRKWNEDRDVLVNEKLQYDLKRIEKESRKHTLFPPFLDQEEKPNTKIIILPFARKETYSSHIST